MINKLYRLIFGYVVFEGICNYPAKLMNIIASEHLNIWDLTCKNFTVRGCIRKSDYRDIHSISKLTGLKVHITSKHGLPFFLKKHRFHIGIPIGSILFIAVLLSLSLFLWRIDVAETAGIKTEAVENALKANGVYTGVLMQSINTELLEQQIMQEINNISWVSINATGSVIKVELKERIVPPTIEDSTKTSNLVASVDGQIVRNEVASGSCVVKVGDVVTQGQILVSGVIEDEEKNTTLKRSKGKIYAYTLHKVKKSTPFVISRKSYLPYSYTRESIRFFDFVIPFKFSKVPSNNCDVYIEKERKNIIGTSIPFEVYRETFYPYEENNTSITIEQAGEVLQEKLKKYEEKKLKDAKILKRNESYTIQDNKYIANVIYECEEDIAQEQILE